MLRRVLILLMISSQAVAAQITLEEEFEYLRLEDVPVQLFESATKVPTAIEKIPSTVLIITSDEMEGARNISEVLKDVPGLYLANDFVGQKIAVRGVFTNVGTWSRGVAVMIDGALISSRSDGSVFLDDLIPIEIVDRIEIIKGPVSALYGNSAFIGVINIITKDPSKAKSSLSLSLDRYGGNPGYSTIGVWRTDTEKLDVIAGGQVYSSDRSGLSLPGDPDAVSRNDTALGQFGYTRMKVGGESGVTASLWISHIMKHGEFQEWSLLTHENKISLMNVGANIEHRLDLTEVLEWRNRLSMAYGGPTSGEHLDVGSEIYWKRRDYSYFNTQVGSELLWRPTSGLVLAAGIENDTDREDLIDVYSVLKKDVGRYHVGDEKIDNAPQGRKAFRNYSSWLQLDLEREKFSVLAGLRYDWHNVFDDFLTWRVGVTYALPRDFLIKYSAGSSFSHPTVMELYTVPFKPGGYLGNPDLDSEKGRYYDLSMSKRFKHASISLGWFHIDLRDMITFAPKGGNLTAVNIETDGEERMGLDGDLSIKVGNWWGYIGYYRVLINTDVEEEREDEFAPKQTVVARIAYKTDNFGVSLIGRLIGEREMPEKIADSSYKTLDFHLCYDREIFAGKETCLELIIHNILNERYVEPGFNVDVPGEPRAIYLKLGQEF